ncbi:DUF3857 domain-containing protein [Subsaximicrobium wynnwilliamsii]|uniref:DUF3857 domain-containing protein n=1 Tax=Subsaximicrobium wynnwilliamsii TaxID=291179 RepID=A0A5C6ZKF3_9FLAO|nr:DUF3857 domain-containing protein [Subsaximicrobium wynnwilliamsii]TXD85365.1 DUF3857 domain-containing protein [Subsaximicrobium wynnwilliamsii]TXD90717.1 DUF3857 domain-containing protein [Subsaximicrobium wynnwilliamsii]TXE05225.1 DUF3857 domain-containing protein [Subsaximicrobium wynnwilliamsii]
MKKITCIIIFLLGSMTYSQDYEFGEVSKAELEEQFNPNDSSASATYLYKYRRTYFTYMQDEGFSLKTEIHERIKIYNQEGFDFATKKFWLHEDGSSREKYESLKGYTYDLVDGKVEDTKLRKDGIFENEKSKYTKEVAFTLPDIKAGCVIEYKYDIISPFISSIDEFELQAEVPIKKLEMSFESPEYFSYKLNTKGYLPVSPKSGRKTGTINFANRTRTSGAVVSSRMSYSKKQYSITTSKYELDNVPALRDEPYVNNIDNYRASVKYELSWTKFPNDPISYYSTTWDDVVKTIYKSDNFGGELDKSNYFEKDLDALLANTSVPMEKAALIFNHVKANVKWNGYYGKYTDVGVRSAYKDHVGNVAEINLMLTAMLRYAGLKANPVLVSSRNNGVPLFPTREGYNYVISAIELENQVVLFDATSMYSTPNILPFRTLNWEGRIIREHGSSALVDLYPKLKAETKTFMNVSLEGDGTITGKIRTFKTNHDAVNYRMSLLDKNRDEFLESLENDYGGIEVSGFEATNDLELSKPLILAYSFSTDNQLEVIGDKLFLSPMLFFTQNENPFKLESREFPVDFGYPSGSAYKINILIPEGYQVESLPESVVLELPNDLGTFKYLIQSDANAIQIAVDYDLNTPIVASTYYPFLKEFFEVLVKKEKEKVVLTKTL